MAAMRAFLAATAIVLALVSGAEAVLSKAERGAGPNGEYFLGDVGINCNEVCGQVGRTCNMLIETNNSSKIFTELGVACTPDPQPWWADNQPGYVSVKSDPNYGKCLGYMGVPTDGVNCDGAYATVQRVCRCTAANPIAAFGTGLSGASINAEESEIFSIVMQDGHVGVMTHFWTTAPAGVLDDAIFRYYIDGEANASVAFTPSMMAGVGFDDAQAPWGTSWIGKGAADGAWFHNFKIPFQKTIRITAQRPSGTKSGFYCIVRGVPNVPITVGHVTVPVGARFHQTITDATFQPLDWVNVVDIPSGTGVHFMSTLSVESGTMNFLEGCMHAYTPYNQSFPGTMLSTGTEDYFDSAWYFNAGEFHLPVSGFTHLTNKNNTITWSAYRFHEMDQLPFSGGFKLVWRVGDVDDPVSGRKCFIENPRDGNTVGRPTVSKVFAYGFAYVWDD